MALAAIIRWRTPSEATKLTSDISMIRALQLLAAKAIGISAAAEPLMSSRPIIFSRVTEFPRSVLSMCIWASTAAEHAREL